jgi:clan AA aspartic protease
VGTFEWPVEIGTPQGDYFQQIAVLVDTGASITIVPRELLEQLGVQPIDREPFELADGRVVEREVGQTWVQVDNRARITQVAFGEPGDATVLGASTLEAVLLAVDPVNQRLIPVRRRFL